MVFDRLTKVAQFIPIVTTMTISRVVGFFVKEILVNYWLLRDIL